MSRSSSATRERVRRGTAPASRRRAARIGAAGSRLDDRLRRAIETVHSLEARLRGADVKIWQLREKLTIARRQLMASRARKRGRARRGEWSSDIERCRAGGCIGGLCPCLCHTSLKLGHSSARS